MESNIEQRFSQSKGVLLLWASWAIGPFAWMIHLSVSYLLAPRACVTGNFLLLYVLTVAMLLMTAGGAFLTWHYWRKLGTEWPGSNAGVSPRSRFMCVVGLLVNVLFFFIILAQAIPMLILKEC